MAIGVRAAYKEVSFGSFASRGDVQYYDLKQPTGGAEVNSTTNTVNGAARIFLLARLGGGAPAFRRSGSMET